MDGPQSAPAATRESGELWIAPRFQVFPLSPRQYLVREPRTGVEIALEAAAFGALQLCSGFRTLDAHARRVSEAMNGQYSAQEVAGLLERLAGAGLLWSASAVAQRLSGEGAAPAPSAEAPLQDVAIRTCGRPGTLERLVQSAAARDREHGVRRRYWVVDDSREPEQQAATRDVVQRAAAELDAVYWGVAAQRSLVDGLSQCLPEYDDTIRWLLSPDVDHGDVTPGRSLNHALLLTAGRPLALLDDDAVLEPQLFGRPGQGLAITSGPSAARSLAVPAAEPGDTVAAVPLDAVGVHGQILGKRLGTLLREQTRGMAAQQRDALASLDTDDLSGLDAGHRVLLSTNAVLGDPGSADSTFLFLLGDEGLYRQMTASPEALEMVSTRRNLWRGDRRLTLALGRSLMFTTCAGIDNRELLPPVAPAGRNEDRLFGAMVRYLHPDALTVSFAWALPHRPDPERQWDRSLLDRTNRAGVNSLLAALSEQTRGLAPRGEPGPRLALVAERLKAFAAADEADFRDYLAQRHLDKRANVVRVLNEELAAHPDAPEFWVRDVRRMISANSQPVGDPALLAALALGGSERPAAEAEQELRKRLARYGEALAMWPMLRAYAAERIPECLAETA